MTTKPTHTNLARVVRALHVGHTVAAAGALDLLAEALEARAEDIRKERAALKGEAMVSERLYGQMNECLAIAKELRAPNKESK